MKLEYSRLIVAAHVSEKASDVHGAHNQYVFKVLPSADKQSIKRAVESLYNVRVASVQVLNVRGKSKFNRQGRGRRSDWRKAYVKLHAGQQIVFENVSADAAV